MEKTELQELYDLRELFNGVIEMKSNLDEFEKDLYPPKLKSPKFIKIVLFFVSMHQFIKIEEALKITGSKFEYI